MSTTCRFKSCYPHHVGMDSAPFKKPRSVDRGFSLFILSSLFSANGSHFQTHSDMSRYTSVTLAASFSIFTATYFFSNKNQQETRRAGFLLVKQLLLFFLLVCLVNRDGNNSNTAHKQNSQPAIQSSVACLRQEWNSNWFIHLI